MSQTIFTNVPEYIRAIAPYVGGKPISAVAREYGLDETKIVKLASNENPLGMPHCAQQAINDLLNNAQESGRYPDGNSFALKTALAHKHQIPIEWLTLGNGSNDILELAARAFLQPGCSAIYAQHAFLVYALATQAVGARAIVVPATATLGHDLPAMRAALADDTRLIFIANPNNPTGTLLPPAEIEAFLTSLPGHVIVLLDQAYNEYLAPELRFNVVDWLQRFPNLIVSRTFSKAYGLAALRIGYAIAQAPLSEILNRIRQPFNVNSFAQSAALAALADQDFLQKSYALNRAGYAQLTQAFEQLGLTYLPSFANFVLVKVGSDENAGAAINLALLKRGIIVRPVANYGLPQWLRISIGLPEENQAFINALRKILHETR